MILYCLRVFSSDAVKSKRERGKEGMIRGGGGGRLVGKGWTPQSVTGIHPDSDDPRRKATCTASHPTT